MKPGPGRPKRHFSEVDIFHAKRKIDLNTQNGGRGPTKYIVNRYSLKELATSLHKRKICWENFVELYYSIMNDKSAGSGERMRAAGELRQLMVWVASSDRIVRQWLGVDPLSADDTPDVRETAGSSGSPFAQTILDAQRTA